MAAAADIPWDQMRAMLKVLAESLLARIPELRQRADASDLVQEALLKAKQAWDHLRKKDPNTLKAWLRGILQNVFKDAVTHALRECRSLDLEKSIHQALDDSSLRLDKLLQAKAALDFDQLLDFAAALEKLPPEERELVLAHDLEGKSLRTIQAETGLDKNKAALKLRQAHGRLARLLKDYEPLPRKPAP
jgi:RNA polymerase sigma-70 factor (ECF subfamily)